MKRRAFLLGLLACSSIVPAAKVEALSAAVVVPYNGSGEGNLQLAEIVRAIKILDDNTVPEPQFIVVPQWWIDAITPPSNSPKEPASCRIISVPARSASTTTPAWTAWALPGLCGTTSTEK
jgi:hypothetical protein